MLQKYGPTPADGRARPNEPDDADSEQRRIAEQEADRQRVEAARLRQKLEEARREEETARAKKQAEKQKKAARKRHDPEEAAERRQKIIRAVLFSAFGLVALYYGGRLAWSMLPQSKHPFPELAAEDFVAEYAKDSTSADAKYIDRVVVIKGALKLVRNRGRLQRGMPDIHVYLALPDQEKIQVEFMMADAELAPELKEGVEYRLTGTVQRYKPGAPLVLNRARATPTGKPTAFLQRQFPQVCERVPPAGTDAVSPYFMNSLPLVHRRFTKFGYKPVLPSRARLGSFVSDVSFPLRSIA